MRAGTEQAVVRLYRMVRRRDTRLSMSATMTHAGSPPRRPIAALTDDRSPAPIPAPLCTRVPQAPWIISRVVSPSRPDSLRSPSPDGVQVERSIMSAVSIGAQWASRRTIPSLIVTPWRLAVAIGSILAIARLSPTSAATDYILMSRSELLSRPTSGAAWTALKARADSSIGTPDISNQDESADQTTFAKALVFARTGVASYRSDVLSALKAAVNTRERRPDPRARAESARLRARRGPHRPRRGRCRHSSRTRSARGSDRC